MAFNERLKEARIASGLTQKQLAEKLGIAGTTVTGYEKGNSEPNVNTIGKIMDILHVDANFLWQDEIKELNTNDFSIPEIKMIKKYRSLDGYGKDMVTTVLEKEYARSTAPKETATVYNLPYAYDLPASAGAGEYAMDIAHFKTVGLTEQPPKGTDFLIRVSGDSMEPKFYDDDKVFVKRMDAIENGEIGLFYLDGNVYVKKQGDGELISLNPQYKPITVNEFSSAKCFGKILGKCECEIIDF